MTTKLLSLFLILTITVLSCKKEDRTIIEETDKKTKDSITTTSPTLVPEIIQVNDSAMDNYWSGEYTPPCSIDINGDGKTDIVFGASDTYSNTGGESKSTMQGLSNTRVTFLQIKHRTWSHSSVVEEYLDTIFTYHEYLQPVPKLRSDTILISDSFTNSKLTLGHHIPSDVETDENPFSHSGLWRGHLVGIGPFYVGLNTNDSLSWVKLEMINYAHVLIHEYSKPLPVKQLVIPE